MQATGGGPIPPKEPSAATQNGGPAAAPDQETLLESMVEAAGRLEIDEESGTMDFHGHSSGIAYLSHLRHQLERRIGEETFSRIRSNAFPGTNNSPRCITEFPLEYNQLPEREVAKVLVNSCLEDACALMRFVHRPTFNEMVDRIYDIDQREYGSKELSFLPLLYLTLAVGCLFASDVGKLGFERATSEG